MKPFYDMSYKSSLIKKLKQQPKTSNQLQKLEQIKEIVQTRRLLEKFEISFCILFDSIPNMPIYLHLSC